MKKLFLGFILLNCLSIQVKAEQVVEFNTSILFEK